MRTGEYSVLSMPGFLVRLLLAGEVLRGLGVLVAGVRLILGGLGAAVAGLRVAVTLALLFPRGIWKSAHSLKRKERRLILATLKITTGPFWAKNYLVSIRRIRVSILRINKENKRAIV